MGYANVLPSWYLEEIIAHQKKELRRWRRMKLKLTARIITGSSEYFKVLSLADMRTPFNKICCQTVAQLESEQFIIEQKGFDKVR